MGAKNSKEVTEVKVGDSLPDLTLREGKDGSPVDVKLLDLVTGKKVAILGVPGAYTPVCSKSHLPSFITAMEDFKKKGIDTAICTATNDHGSWKNGENQAE